MDAPDVAAQTVHDAADAVPAMAAGSVPSTLAAQDPANPAAAPVTGTFTPLGQPATVQDAAGNVIAWVISLVAHVVQPVTTMLGHSIFPTFRRPGTCLPQRPVSGVCATLHAAW